MADKTPAKVEATETTKTSCFKYIGINIAIILALLLITEVIFKESVLDETTTLILTAVVALIPLAGMFVGFGELLGIVSVPLTLCFSAILFYFRFRVILFYIIDGGVATLTVDEYKHVIGELSSNRVVVVLNVAKSEFENGLTRHKLQTTPPMPIVELPGTIPEGPTLPSSDFDKNNISEGFTYFKKVEKNKIFLSTKKFSTIEEAKNHAIVLGEKKASTA